MAQSQSSKPQNSRGFTIVEVLVAAFILFVGLVAVAGVVGSTLSNTARSEYMTQAATLATEKLEDLNRFPSTDANIAVTGGSSAGGLTSDIQQDVTVNGVTQSVNYYDEVYFSPSLGSMQETESSLDTNNNVQYITTTYTPDGHMNTSQPAGTPPASTGSTVFKRRWIIEQGTPVTGVRRITVLVTLLNQSTAGTVTFQMSMVRP